MIVISCNFMQFAFEQKVMCCLPTGSVMVERSPPEREVVSSNHSRVIPKT